MFSKIADNYSPVYTVNYDNRQLQPMSFRGDIGKTDTTTPALNRQSIANKVAISFGIALALAISADFIFGKGKHIKSLSNKLKINKTKPEVKSEINPVAKPKAKPEIKSEIIPEEKPKCNVKVAQIPAGNISGTNISAIKSDEEFFKVLEKLKKDSSWNKDWNIEGANLYEIGLMPYSHTADIHSYINSYLREGKLSPNSEFTKDIIKDYVRITDYALNKLDKVYGEYQGVVYRYGWFNSTPEAFTSTASTPFGAVCHSDKFRPYKQRYNIIFTRHGSKIEKMQEKLGNLNLAQREQEILLRPGHKFEEIKTLTPELEKLKQELFETMKKEHGYLCEDLVNLHFWQEI